MTNTINNQPAGASLLTTDYLLAWQGSQSPQTRKLPVSGLAPYYALLTGATYSGAVVVSSGGITVTGNSVITGTLTGLTQLVVASGGATISGNSTLNNNVTVGGNLVVDNAATITGLVTATGGLAAVNQCSIVDATASHTGLNFVMGSGLNAFVGFNIGASGVGSITYTGTATAYNTTSDERLKLDDGLIDPESAGSIIDRIMPRWFRWRSRPDDSKSPGFFAQQLQRVFPWAVTVGKGEPEDMGFRPWQVDASKLMPLVIAELQALRARVSKLEG